eukprot:SAG22_NODE_1753_length_3656_cov_8.396683_2_plen_94_part_00
MKVAVLKRAPGVAPRLSPQRGELVGVEGVSWVDCGKGATPMATRVKGSALKGGALIDTASILARRTSGSKTDDVRQNRGPSSVVSVVSVVSVA